MAVRSIPSDGSPLGTRNRRSSSKPWAVVSQWSRRYGVGVYFEAVTFLQLIDDFVCCFERFVGHLLVTDFIGWTLFWWFQGCGCDWTISHGICTVTLWILMVFYILLMFVDSWTHGEMNWEELTGWVYSATLRGRLQFLNFLSHAERIITRTYFSIHKM